jgi:hypothetical protein
LQLKLGWFLLIQGLTAILASLMIMQAALWTVGSLTFICFRMVASKGMLTLETFCNWPRSLEISLYEVTYSAFVV